MDNQELIEFIHEAGLHTYADPNAPKRATPYRPSCEEYEYVRGDWKYLDSYAWMRDGGGAEIVYYQDKPVWVMNYYGFLTDQKADSKEVYSFLHEALRLRHPVLPVRGDALADPVRKLRYEVIFERDEVSTFSGVERIYKDEALVYECFFHGGSVR
jgi:hypothetical protein